MLNPLYDAMVVGEIHELDTGDQLLATLRRSGSLLVKNWDPSGEGEDKPTRRIIHPMVIGKPVNLENPRSEMVDDVRRLSRT